MTTDQEKKLPQTEDGVQSTEEAEKKVQDNEQVEKEPEVQVVSTQKTTEPGSTTGIPETLRTQW